MIRELTLKELRRDFFALLGELECGSDFDATNPGHSEWLDRQLGAREILRVRSFGSYPEERPGGFISVQFDEGPPGLPSFGHQARILDLGFFLPFRGQNLGARLLAQAQHVATQEKYSSLVVATYAKQERAIRFYLREGFVPVATLPDVHGPDDEGMAYLRKQLA